MANGITKETKAAVKAGVNMSKATEEGIRDTLGVHSLSKIFKKIGSWVPESISAGIQNGKNSLVNTAKDLGINTGNVTVNGIASSIAGSEGGLTSGINALLDLLAGTTTPGRCRNWNRDRKYGWH